MKKVIICIADGFEEIEALGTADILRRGKAQVDLVSITDNKELIGANGIKVICDDLFINANPNDYDLLVLPGGMANAEALSNSSALIETIQKFNQENKLIAGICASPAYAIAKSGIAKGKKITCYPGLENSLSESSYQSDKLVVDGNLITANGPASTLLFAYKLLEILNLDYQAVEKGMLYI